jgi:hypothetical protein
VKQKLESIKSEMRVRARRGGWEVRGRGNRECRQRVLLAERERRVRGVESDHKAGGYADHRSHLQVSFFSLFFSRWCLAVVGESREACFDKLSRVMTRCPPLWLSLHSLRPALNSCLFLCLSLFIYSYFQMNNVFHFNRGKIQNSYDYRI